MNKAKKIFSALAVIAILLSAFPIIPVFAETYSGKCGENAIWEYNSETSTLVISGNGRMYDFKSGLSPWEKETGTIIEEINEVIFKDGISYIGSYYFEWCSINVLTLPASITGIGEYAFNTTKHLNINSLEKWFEIDFANAQSNPLSNDTTLYLNDNKIENIVIPTTVNRLKSYVLYRCPLNTVVIPENILYIEPRAFWTGSITNVVVEKNNNSYFSNSNCVFEKKTGKLVLGNKDGIIPSNVQFKIIGDSAFYDCSFKSVIIPEGVVEIEASAFSGNRQLEEITIPKSLERVADDSICRSYRTVKVNISDLKSWCKIDFGETAYGWPSRDNFSLYLNGSQISNLTIPYGITEIKNYAFSYCDGIISVTIPDSVTNIGKYAFYRCRDLVNVSMSNNITSIGYSAFEGCTALTSVTMSENVANLERRAFFDCSSLENIKIPESVKKIGEKAFSRCEALKYVDISSVDEWCKIDFEHAYYDFSANPLYYAKNLYLNGESIKHLIISDSVKKISYGAFVNCPNITEITISNGVQEIDDWAFLNCSGLIGINMPNSITNLGYGAFSGCNNLLSLKLSDSIKKISSNAFEGCSIKELEIPNGVTVIGREAFKNCYELKNVYIPESLEWCGENVFENCGKLDVFITSLEKWCKIDFNDPWNNAKSNPLSCGGKLYENGVLVENLIIPNSVTGIKPFAFQGCESIKSATIPSGAKFIEMCAFNSTHLKNVYIPKSVTYIGSYAFDDEITDIYYEGTQKEWNKINVDYYNLSNRVLQKAKIHYNSLGIYEYTPGDLDGNDEVTDADAEYLLMHTFFPDEYPVNQNCDFNNDGAVTDADAEYLLMFTFFPEEYPIN